MSLNKTNVNINVFTIKNNETENGLSNLSGDEAECSDDDDNDTTTLRGEKEEDYTSSKLGLQQYGENVVVDTLVPITASLKQSSPKSKPIESEKTECQELKTLRYKIMLMNGNTPVEEICPNNSYDNLQKFLEKEKNNNTKETWSKLNKSMKYKKLTEYVQNYTQVNGLTEKETHQLIELLKSNMSRGKLVKTKEVNYDKNKGIIKDMPCLVFNKSTRHFTIKNMEGAKHTTTLKKNSTQPIKAGTSVSSILSSADGSC